MKISEYFMLDELCRSDVAARNGIDMSPSAEVLANLTHWAREIGDPLRKYCACPLIVTSGYRPVALNKLIGGVATSDHILGLAVDLHAQGHDIEWLMNRVREIAVSLPIKQCIIEFASWVHVSIDLGRSPKREFLTATRKDGQTIYAAA